MSASSNAILRGIRALLSTLGLVQALPDKAFAAVAVADTAVMVAARPVRLFATIEIVAPELPDPPDGGTPAALPIPVLAQTSVLATMYRAANARPLAAQMAVTARRNVPKGRKSATSVKIVSSSKPTALAKLPRRATAIKAKPVVLAIKKKAPKRRHVWLSTQSRVIRTVTANVVQMAAPRTQRQTARLSAKTAAWHLKLAA